MDETSGALRPAIEAYLTGGPMSPEGIAAVRAYLRQWIFAGDFIGTEIARLRAMIDGLMTRQDIGEWLDVAAAQGIDPL